MADIEKMGEIFEEVLKEYESSELVCICENGYPDDETNLDKKTCRLSQSLQRSGDGESGHDDYK